MKLSLIALLSSFCGVPVASDIVEGIAYCDGCWCVPPMEEACPTDSIPQIDFADSYLDNLRAIPLENGWSMSCNPYLDENCSTEPPVEEGEACVAEIIAPEGDDSAQCPQDYSYRLKTVASREEAEKNLQIVTHEGACGACSTFQDLALYISIPDLATVGIACGLRALINVTDGLLCYQEFGFTPACARIWIDNTLNTILECPMCLTHGLQQKPNNFEPPTCYLADCIECDEIESGPLFKKFAGRTRRNSNLLSKIVRNCTEHIPRLVHRDPCDDTAVTMPPTSAPTDDSGTTVYSFIWATFSSIIVLSWCF